MNRKLGQELRHAVKQAEADDAVGCIVITGAGERAFTAGGDIQEQLSNDTKFTDSELDAMRDSRRSYERPMATARCSLVTRHARRLRRQQIPLSGRRLWPHQQHLDAAQSGGLADGQGTAVHRAHRRS